MDFRDVITNILLLTFIQCATLLIHIRRRLQQNHLRMMLAHSMQHTTGYFGVIQSRIRKLWMKKRSQEFWETTILKDYDEEDWLQTFRISREMFMTLVDSLRPAFQPASTQLQSREPISPDKQVAITLYFLASTAEYRVVGDLFGVHKTTVWRCIHRVVDAINSRLMEQWIKMPSEEECERISGVYQDKSGIPQIIGSIDGCHIPITAPSDGHHDYINRKGWASVVLQAVVDDHLIFRNVYVGCPGSSHDAWVLKMSNLFKHSSQLIPQRTKRINGMAIPYFLIGDPAYPLLRWLIKAYQHGPYTSEAEKTFSRLLNSCRVHLELAFDRLKARWRCLCKLLDIHHTFVPSIVLACIILHNMLQSQQQPFLNNWQRELDASMYVQPEQEESDQDDNDDGDVDAQQIRNTLRDNLLI